MSEKDRFKGNRHRQFHENQYKILRRCAEKWDITEWNEWRKANMGTNIHLKGAGKKSVTPVIQINFYIL